MNHLEILQAHPTIKDLQANVELWKSMNMKDRLEILKQYAGRANLVQAPTPLPIVETKPVETVAEVVKALTNEKPTGTFNLSIQLNEMQQAAVDRVYKGQSFCLTGKAGTGKTTTLRELMKALLKAGYRPSDIAAGAFTRIATANIRRALEKDTDLFAQIGGRIKTIHKHLEYMPNWWQDSTGKWHMEFKPTKTEKNPFSFKLLIIEESSMVDLLLYEKLYDAMRTGTILIFVGDINQLPPVFGKSIFNYALHQLPVIELSEVYRQALDSGIIQNALRILDGQVPVTNKDCDVKWFKNQPHMGQAKAGMSLGGPDGVFHKLYKSGGYNPKTDIILSPWNKQEMGTIAMNNWIAQFLGDEREAVVHEIIAGRRKLYLAVGDQVFIDKQLGIITEIAINGGYAGKSPAPASKDLLRIGQYRIGAGLDTEADFELTGYENINADEIADDEKKNQASHVVKVQMEDYEETWELMTAGEFSENAFSLGYCLTVHKAQGCEWQKVFIIMHTEHTSKGNFVSRELLYTAVTRAREKLVIFAKDTVLERGVANQVIKGRTLEEKIAFINSGAQNIGDYPVIKMGEWEELPGDDEIEDEPPVQTARIAIAPARKKMQVVDFEKYVSEMVKNAAQTNLKRYWDNALAIWGDELGELPTLSFDCQKAQVLGLASPKHHRVKLNPVWCVAAEADAQLLHDMTDTIVAHEVAHLVTARYVKVTGHGPDWKMTMKLLKQKPEQFYHGNLPNWKETCEAILEGKGIVNVDIEDTDLEEGEEE